MATIQIRDIPDETYESIRLQDVPLLTCDARPARTPGLPCEVEVVA